MFHFLSGSPNDYASWPAQTVNYTESHDDDRACIDVITERADFRWVSPDGRRHPAFEYDVRTFDGFYRDTYATCGPGFFAFQGGVNNTYQRGDLNALSFLRRAEFAVSSEYLSSWIAFRQSELGRLLRHYSRATVGFFKCRKASGRNASAVLYNADNSLGPSQLLFAVNPEFEELVLPLGDWKGAWRQLADHDRFWGFDDVPFRNDLNGELRLPPLASGLWMRTMS